MDLQACRFPAVAPLQSGFVVLIVRAHFLGGTNNKRAATNRGRTQLPVLPAGQSKGWDAPPLLAAWD